ncbi:hypothetical protein [Macrococcus brunensis]|uniref:hypothetical protein n=1 Tax=Macrococcus brunensis TaxID=198483 RepID=UPI001EEF8074|nr:hypothetical protein [Macrococcus brunensis]ULG73021.1 hypothetical protein MGG12_05760 [Macrococcus brunensis]
MAQSLMLYKVTSFDEHDSEFEKDSGIFLNFEAAKEVAEAQIGVKHLDFTTINGVIIEEYQDKGKEGYQRVSQWLCLESDAMRWEWSAVG